MKNKGFTLIEIITTFALSATIIILLMNVIIIIKNIYSTSDLRTDLLINQANLSNVLNSKINNNNLLSYEPCTDKTSCYVFTLVEEEIRLEVTEEKIIFGNYVYEAKEGVTIQTPTIIKENNLDITDTTVNNSFLVIKIPITSSQYPNEDFGINLIYQYNSNIVSI